MACFTRVLVSSIRHGGMFALAFPLFSFFAFAVGLDMLQSSQALARLERDGVPAVGEVSAVRAVDLGDMGQSDVRYFVTCRFRVGEGELVERETKVADGRWRSLRKGDAVAVRYSRSDPAVWDIPTGTSAANTRFAMWACFIAGAVSAAIYCSGLAAEASINRRWPEPERTGCT